jgi:hypothetical protein
MYPTIVTMLYDIQTMEQDENTINENYKKYKSNRSTQQYLELGNNFILNLPCPIVLFTDVEEVKIFVKNLNKSNIHVYEMKYENMYFLKDSERLKQLQTTYTILNSRLDHETPSYIMLTNNKFDFLEKAIELNKFNSSHFMWMDFGINHVAKDTHMIHDWLDKIPDKIKQLCINPYLDNVEPIHYFQYIYHNTAAGLFSGSKENMLKYIDLFKKKNDEIYSQNWYQLEEAVMTLVQLENNELFDFYYGDYPGIVSNYLSPIHSFWVIELSMIKYMKYNNTKQLYEMLLYMDTYFNTAYNDYDKFFYLYIKANLKCNYYENGGVLRSYVVDLINSVLNVQEKKTSMIDFLNENKELVQMYSNQKVI